MGGLIGNLGLFPFMYRGKVEVPSNDETEAFDSIDKTGIYTVSPTSGSWGTLVIFTAFIGAGGIVQLHYHVAGARYRVKKSNTDNIWTEWKAF